MSCQVMSCHVIKAVTVNIAVFCDVTKSSMIVCKTSRCYVLQNNVIVRHPSVVICFSKCFEEKCLLKV